MQSHYEPMFMDAVQALAEISKALRIHDKDAAVANGNASILTAIEQLWAANVKLAGALDMIRETLHGGDVQDLLYIINTALDTHHVTRA